ncbi:MAG: hypothetical protein ACRER6_17110, partial [Pseudomonas sp.]
MCDDTGQPRHLVLDDPRLGADGSLDTSVASVEQRGLALTCQLRELTPKAPGILLPAAGRCIGFITQQLPSLGFIEIRQQGFAQIGVRQSVDLDRHGFYTSPDRVQHSSVSTLELD